MQTPLFDTCLALATGNKSADQTSAAIDGADRRRSERTAACTPAYVSGESHDRSARGRDVVVNDLSMHGVGFRDPKAAYRIGACHWLVMNGTAMRLSTRIRIVSCRENPAGGFDVGAKFY